jgi:photosynthetic reaction center cytochrome c subunit
MDQSRNYIAFLIVFVLVTGALVLITFGVITFVYNTTVEADEEQADIEVDEALSAIYVDYYNNADQYVSGDSYLAMGQYAGEFPEPQNVIVLEGLSTTGVIGYMLNHMTAAMGVNCTYCHSLDNFAADVWEGPGAEEAMANKMLAREYLRMVADLNQNWLTQLPDLVDTKQPYGAQISCATCHYGQAVPQTWPENEDLRLALDPEVVYSVDEQGILNVNARNDISLDAVQYNQAVMYHMNTSLGVGCTHCHNSRYFPDYQGVPAKNYTINMLQMTQYIWNNYADILGGQQPSCNMCHNGAPIPGGAVRNADIMPEALRSDYEAGPNLPGFNLEDNAAPMEDADAPAAETEMNDDAMDADADMDADASADDMEEAEAETEDILG